MRGDRYVGSFLFLCVYSHVAVAAVLRSGVSAVSSRNGGKEWSERYSLNTAAVSIREQIRG